MSDLSLILLAAGNSTRFECGVKKQWLRVGSTPLWQFVTDRFISTKQFAKVIIVGHADETEYMKLHGEYTIIAGGDSRQASLQNAMALIETPFVMVSDVARGCVAPELIARLASARALADCVVPVLPVHDTVTLMEKTIDRAALRRIQTPQISTTAALTAALQTDTLFTDESSAIVTNGGSRHCITGDEGAHKLTTLSDLAALKCLQPASNETLIGIGMDVHAFDSQGSMTLGGVAIEHPVGFKAHSDGDVAVHALIDALLGAAGIGDIGTLFPDTDSAYKGIDSIHLLEQTLTLLRQYGFVPVNVDLTIAAQTPKLSPYNNAMRHRLSTVLGIAPVRIGIKATTTEALGFIGRKEGVAVLATAAITYLDWSTQ